MLVVVSVLMLSDSKLGVVAQVGELSRLVWLVLGLENVCIQEGGESRKKILSVGSSMLVDFCKRQSGVLSDSKDIVTQMSYPDSAELLVLGTRLLGEGSHKGATDKACGVPDRP